MAAAGGVVVLGETCDVDDLQDGELILGPPPRSRWWVPSGLAPLTYGNYVLYLAGQAFSHVGTAMENTAASWLLYELTGSPLLLGVGGLFRVVPILAFALFGGAFADRFSKRAILFITQVTDVCTSLALGALIFTGLVQPWHIYLFNFLNATIQAFVRFVPSKLAA